MTRPDRREAQVCATIEVLAREYNGARSVRRPEDQALPAVELRRSRMRKRYGKFEITTNVRHGKVGELCPKEATLLLFWSPRRYVFSSPRLATAQTRRSHRTQYGGPDEY